VTGNATVNASLQSATWASYSATVVVAADATATPNLLSAAWESYPATVTTDAQPQGGKRRRPVQLKRDEEIEELLLFGVLA
jgi:hypothetical protein